MTTVRTADDLGTVLPSRIDEFGTHLVACTDDHGTKPKVEIILRNPRISRDGDRCTRIIRCTRDARGSSADFRFCPKSRRICESCWCCSLFLLSRRSRPPSESHGKEKFCGKS